MPAHDPFLLQLLVIFLWAKVFGELFERLRIPAVLGELLAGVILGPFATGLVVPSDAVQSVGGLGAIFLLFSVGLTTHPKELISIGRRSLGVAVGGVVLPFALGFGYFMLAQGKAVEATFIGTAMVATSVGITARVLGDLQMLQTRAAKIILAAAVLDDILGMMLLAMVGGLAAKEGVNWTQLSVLGAETLVFVLFMTFVAPRVIGRFQGRVEGMTTQNAPLIAALAICLGLSVAAERIGMAAIIGAFFAGLAFAEHAPRWALQARVGALTEFLAPFFFFLMGAKLNLAAMDRKAATMAAVISLLALVSKVLGCGLPALNEGWRVALKVGVGMTPRGEVGLIVALIGLNTGSIDATAYAVVMMMTMVTTLAAPMALRYLFRGAPEPQPAAAVPL